MILFALVISIMDDNFQCTLIGLDAKMEPFFFDELRGGGNFKPMKLTMTQQSAQSIMTRRAFQSISTIAI